MMFHVLALLGSLMMMSLAAVVRAAFTPSYSAGGSFLSASSHNLDMSSFTTSRRRRLPSFPLSASSSLTATAVEVDTKKLQNSADVWTMKAAATTSAKRFDGDTLRMSKTEMFLTSPSSLSFSNRVAFTQHLKANPKMLPTTVRRDGASSSAATTPSVLIVKGLAGRTAAHRQRTRGVLGFQVDEHQTHHHHHTVDKGHERDSTSTRSTSSSNSSNSKSKLQATRRATTTGTTSWVDSPSSSTWNGIEQEHWKVDLSNNGPPVTSVTSEKTNNDSKNSWLSWIPTPQQIDSLTVVQLKQVLQQRGLPYSTGNKQELRMRLHDWMNRQRRIVQQSLAISHNALIWQNGEHGDHDDLDEHDEHYENCSSASIIADTTTGVNSLAEWARTVDLEPLLQRREEIHREKRLGKKSHHTTNMAESDLRNKSKDPKEYLSSLTKVFDESPPASSSSSSSSVELPLNNFQVQQMYAAAKKADLQGNRALSRQILQQLQKATPHDGRIYRRLSRLEKEMGNVSGARAILQKGIRNLGKVASSSSPRDAFSKQRQQQQHGPTLAFLCHGLGQLADSNPEAKRCYQKAIACDPSLPHPYHALGTLEHTEGKIAPAMKILKQGISYCPTNHRLHHALGDLYRDAKLLDMARKSYNKALLHGPDISHGFAYTALAYIAYEQGSSSSSNSNSNNNHDEFVDECRIWLKKAIRASQGRQAKAWVALAQMEEAEGKISAARATCIAALAQYERGLVQRAQSDYYSSNKQGQQTKRVLLATSVFGRNVTDHNNNSNNSIDEVTAIKNSFWRQVPVYRSGDRFYQVYRNWARLEERYGTMESVDEVYQRAIMAFPNEWKFRVDWAMYYQKQMQLPTGRARELFSLACSKAAHRHGDPCRLYAQLEMSLGNFEQARKILFRGAVAMSELSGNGGGGGSSSSSSGSGRQRHCSSSQDGLAELYHTWGVCEWHLDNLPRAQNLFDHALRMTSDDLTSRRRGGTISSGGSTGSDSSKLRSLILYSMARLHNYRGDHLLAQHCIALALNECTTVPRIWDLWALVADKMGNVALSEKCQEQADLARAKLESQENEQHQPPEDMRPLMRRDPWYHKIFENGFHSKNKNDADNADDADDDDVYRERAFRHGVRLPRDPIEEVIG
jgi:tetratricopeptide (TPR) repeat protein